MLWHIHTCGTKTDRMAQRETFLLWYIGLPLSPPDSEYWAKGTCCQEKIYKSIFFLTRVATAPTITAGGNMQDKSYSVREAADALGLSPGAVRKYCRDKKIECFQIGNRYRITKETIDGIRNGTIKVK
jgi:excisionase family DNA binding protein